MTNECDGSASCPAQVHIDWCYAQPRETQEVPMTEMTEMTAADMPCVPERPQDVALWCAHLPGDDVIAAENRREAQRIADAVNGILRVAAAESEAAATYGAPATAHACAWPWTADAWRESCETFESWARGDEC